jgi:dTDP-4-dehydrorhamnose reductase
MRVLITGGSGYLGQFFIVGLSSAYEVAYTYCSTALESCSAQAFKVNIATGEGLSEAVLGFKPEVVINCAAVSQPAVCEQSYETCRALNRPSRLVESLQQLREQYHVTALLIHLSTDQVWPNKPGMRSSCNRPCKHCFALACCLPMVTRGNLGDVSAGGHMPPIFCHLPCHTQSFIFTRPR